MPKYNPYYSPERLELEMICFDEPGLRYEFNTLCFWAYKGMVYTAQDSGCSCPKPFEDYEGETTNEVLQLLERVGSPEQAGQIFDAWNGRRDDRKLPKGDRDEVIFWVKHKLENAI